MAPRAPSRPAPGFTVVELLIVVAIVGVLVAMAMPAVLNARRSANEASAVAALRAIASAQQAYAATCGEGAYATALPQLGRPPASGGTPFLGPELTASDTVVKSGYRVTLSRADDGVPAGLAACNGVDGDDLATSFYATAVPAGRGVGARYYWLGVPGTIFADEEPIRSADGMSAMPGGAPISSGGAGATADGTSPPPRPGGGSGGSGGRALR